MAIVGSGLGASVGLAAETAFGTFVAPQRWLEFQDEKFVWKPKIVEGKSLNGQLTPSLTQRIVTSSRIEGSLKTYLHQNLMGVLFQQLFGNATSTENATTGTYTQAFSIGDVQGKSLSFQINRPDITKADHVYSYSGMKVSGAKLTIGTDEFADVDWTLIGQQVSYTQVLSAPAINVTNPPFHFVESSIVAGNFGSEVVIASVDKADIDFKRPFNSNRIPIGSNGLMNEPIQNAVIEISGSLNTEFVNATDWEQAFRTQAPLSLILSFTGGQIATGYNASFSIHLPSIAFEGESPTVNGPDILKPAYAFKAFDDGTHGLAAATYVTTDATI